MAIPCEHHIIVLDLNCHECILLRTAKKWRAECVVVDTMRVSIAAIMVVASKDGNNTT